MKTLNPKILAVAAVIAIAAVCPAHAKEMSKGMDMSMMNDNMMKMMDTNSDGMVSKDEMMAYHEKMMGMADMNKDGMLSKDEMMSMMKMDHNTMMGKSNMMMDKDGAMMSK